MFWKFSLFEIKLLLKNRKSAFIALFLLLFFPLFFMYYSHEEPKDLAEQKREETQTSYAVFYHLDQQRHDVPEVAEVFDYHSQIQSLLGMQVWNIGSGKDGEQYVEEGLEINQLRLKVHELGNEGIPDYLIIPKEEILKENALLEYIKDNNLPVDSESFMTNNYFADAFAMMSGLVFLVIILISGNELLVYELKHQSVMRGLPLAFMRKVTGKVMVYSIFIYLFLLLGFSIGSLYLSGKMEGNEISFPILIYQNEAYTAISASHYLLYLFLGMALVTILLLLLSILLNMLFKNAFANILVGLGIYLLPDIVMAAGFNLSFLHPVKFIDMSKVLSGELAVELGNSFIDYWNAMAVLGGISLLLIGVIYAINKFDYRRIPKDMPLEKTF
ncbi:hypothetical protein [Oceanobacillus neutriphilus]|uniref:ABC transporter permease n=1 Tax=Oceanobacillus neutriphilus TaxID=531815 RepID=A0ABQ2NUU7_9BACI|nr:hypothetical protein [Oceanobacillus neutriphilus]GGP11090.1 hypothetical protein GCM10011346_21820 [Oceanobacillus neutriphilus]